MKFQGIKLLPGDLFCSFKYGNIVSTAIRLADGGNFSHVVGYIGRGRAIESATGGVKIVPVQHYTHNSDYVILVKRLRNQGKVPALIKGVRTKLGLKYSYLQNAWDLFLMGLLWVTGKDYRKVWNKDYLTGEVNCSELWAAELKAIGEDIMNGLNPSYASPRMFEQNYTVLEDVAKSWTLEQN